MPFGTPLRFNPSWARIVAKRRCAIIFARILTMTKGEETRLANLARKQGFETLEPKESKELKRLSTKKAAEAAAGLPVRARNSKPQSQARNGPG
jgi:hypothetical protein